MVIVRVLVVVAFGVAMSAVVHRQRRIVAAIRAGERPPYQPTEIDRRLASLPGWRLTLATIVSPALAVVLAAAVFIWPRPFT